MQDIIIVGFGGHGKSVADAIERVGDYRIVGYTDVQELSGCKYRYVGTDDVLFNGEYDRKKIKLTMGLGYMGQGSLRTGLFQHLKERGYEFPVIIDPSAIVSEAAGLGEGTFVGKGAIINADVQIGRGCIINSGAIVEHECTIGNETHIAVGATLCGQVSVGKSSMIGANATVNQGLKIGKHTIIGAGAVVTSHIDDNVVAVGVPARVIKTNEG